jgi:hypothetical protein
MAPPPIVKTDEVIKTRGSPSYINEMLDASVDLGSLWWYGVKK